MPDDPTGVRMPAGSPWSALALIGLTDGDRDDETGKGPGMPDPVRTTTLLIAAITLGMMAGLFYAYAGSVMPGLRGADDRTVVDAMQRFNTAIQNGLFLLLFLGALGSTGVAAVLHTGAARRPVFVPVVVALVLYALTLLITFAVNIPLNNRLAQAGPAQRLADPGAVRTAFYGRWVRWNIVRTLACAGAFGAMCWALVQYGRL
jgi:uncharacterized membrane protein